MWSPADVIAKIRAPGASDGALARLGEKGLERSEGEGVQDDRDAALRGRVTARAGDGRHDFRTLAVVGRVDVEELGFSAGRGDLGDDPIDVRLRGFPIEVYAEDVPARLRQGDRAGLAEAGRGAENEGPPGTRLAGQNGADVSTAIRVSEAERSMESRAVNSAPGGD
jgi:hypothetical protein